MKKILALILAGLLVATAAAAMVGAEETTWEDAYETVEEELDTTGDTAEEDTTEEAEPIGPIEPLVYGNFTISQKDLVKASDNSEISLNNGILELRPVDNDVWNSEEEGDWVDAHVTLAIDWHVREGYKNGLYTAQKVILKKDMKYVAVKVKQQDNYAPETGVELTLYVADPSSPRVDSGYPIYSLTTIQGDDGFSYMLFDVAACDDADMFYNQMLTSIELMWASCEVVNRETAYLDLYEIAIIRTAEELDAYVGTEVEWVTEPDAPDVVEPEDDEEEQTTAAVEAGDDSILSMLGCQGSVASAVAVVAATVAAGAVVIRKKRED